MAWPISILTCQVCGVGQVNGTDGYSTSRGKIGPPDRNGLGWDGGARREFARARARLGAFSGPLKAVNKAISALGGLSGRRGLEPVNAPIGHYQPQHLSVLQSAEFDTVSVVCLVEIRLCTNLQLPNGPYLASG